MIEFDAGIARRVPSMRASSRRPIHHRAVLAPRARTVIDAAGADRRCAAARPADGSRSMAKWSPTRPAAACTNHSSAGGSDGCSRTGGCSRFSLTVAQNLDYGLARVPREAPRRFTPEARVIEVLDVGALARRYSRPTSPGGERQRIAIGRALLAQPRLLPRRAALSSLDAAAPRDINRARAAKFPAADGLHHATRWPVLRIADRMVLLERGQVDLATARRGTRSRLDTLCS